MIEGVLLTPLRCIEGAAGAVLHALKQSADGFVGFGEAYFSEIHGGAVKSWRRHNSVTLNLVVPVGSVRFVIYDQSRFVEHRVGRANYARLTVPPGLWLAFQGLGSESSLVLSIIDMEHDPKEADMRDLDAFAYRW